MALLTASVDRVYARASLMSNALQIFLLLTAGYLLLAPPVFLRWISWSKFFLIYLCDLSHFGRHEHIIDTVLSSVSMYFYSFRILILSQFRDRTFACPGETGILATQVSSCSTWRVLST
jgi:hypothetical protein